MTSTDACTGALLGTAIGDAVLLPGEGMSRVAIARRFPGPLRHCLLFGRGLVSDDTEHAFLTAQALLTASDDVARFRRSLAWKLRWWFAALPGGVGIATAKACIRLWLGVSPERSGVWSAGNGPSMRAAIIGVRFSGDASRRGAFIDASTTITHRDPKARHGARAIAEAAAWAVRHEPLGDLWPLLVVDADDEWRGLMATLRNALDAGTTVAELADRLGCGRGVSGYTYHSVPVALYAWLRHRGDARAGLEALFRCGGDVDTMGAFAGALFGAEGSEAGLPADWIAGIIDRPLSVAVLRRAGSALASGGQPVRWWWSCQPLRNLGFILVVLAHGFRRLLP